MTYAALIKLTLLSSFAVIVVSACGRSETPSDNSIMIDDPDIAKETLSPPISQVYNETRFISDGWPGELPEGVAILADVNVLGRELMRPLEVQNRACELPRGANFQPGNTSRNRRHEVIYRSANIASPLTLTAEITSFNPARKDGSKLKITKDDKVQYLTLAADDRMLISVNDTEYEVPVEAFEGASNIEDVLAAEDAMPVLWLKIRCDNDLSSWFRYEDLIAHPDIEPSPYKPMKSPKDLTETDIAVIRAYERDRK